MLDFFCCLFVKCSVFLSKNVIKLFLIQKCVTFLVGRNDFLKYGMKSMY